MTRRDVLSLDEVAWHAIDAVLFDLDGVLTPTAAIHEQAWKEMFDTYLAERAAGSPFVPFSSEDYLAHVDGRRRVDGVRTFLASRGIHLREGQPDDDAGIETVNALGNAKNAAFLAVLRRDGIAPFRGAVELLDALDRRGVRGAVVTSSRNGREVLAAAGLAERFTVVVDGNVAIAEHLSGKPAPDTFLHAATLLAVPAERCAIAEDAISGVAAGRAGRFALVVGVDRGAGHDALLANGADVVVDDPGELVTGVLASSRSHAAGEGSTA